MRTIKKNVHAMRNVTCAFVLTMGAGSVHAQEAQTINVAMHYSQDQIGPLMECFARYEVEREGVKVNYQQLSYGDYLQTVLTSRLGGQAPDIYHLYSIWAPQLVDNGVLAEPPDSIREFVEAGYAPATVAAATMDGTLWGVPSEVSTYQLVSNMALLEEAGYSEPPTTFEQFKEIAGKISTRDAQGKLERTGFAFAESSSGAGLVHPFYAYLFSKGVEVYTEGFEATNLASDEAVSVLEDFRSLVKDGVTDRSVDGYDFPAGGIGMIIMANWLESDIRAGFGERFDRQVRVSPIPFGDSWQSMQYSFFFGVDSNSEASEDAWELIRWINSPESSGAAEGPSCVGQMLDELGALTANEADNAALPEPDAFTSPYVEALRDGRTMTQPNVLQAAEIEGLMARTIDEAISGDVMPREALEALDREVSDILFEFY